MPTDHSSSDGQRQCRSGASVDVELHAAMALADMAGVGLAEHARPVQHAAAAQAAEQEDEELASTRLSLELGNVGIQSSPCSSSSSGAGHNSQMQAAAQQLASAAPGYGPRPRHMLTEAEKEAKRLRRVLANRESARQTILRRQAIRDELARKVADLASQNETMKKEKDKVLEQYISLKETNKQLKEQVAKTTKKKAAAAAAAAATAAMDTATQQQHAEASPPATPPQPSFMYSAPPPAMPVPVPYVWGSWPPYDHGNLAAGVPGHAAPAPMCLPPACAWYYPVVTAAAADPHSSPPSTYVQPFQELPRAAEPMSCGAGGGGGGSPAGRDNTADDPCSLTLAIDADKKISTSTPVVPAVTGGANTTTCQTGGGGGSSSSLVVGVGLQVALSGREKAATAAEARKRRKELTKLKHMHGGSRHGAGDQWEARRCATESH